MIDQRSSMGALGDMNRYMQFQAAQAMGNMGQGGGGAGGGGLETGAGLGAGLALGGAFAGMLNQSMQSGAQMAGPGRPAGPAAASRPAGGPGQPHHARRKSRPCSTTSTPSLSPGKISEGTYNTLTAKWEQRLAQLGGQH